MINKSSLFDTTVGAAPVPRLLAPYRIAPVVNRKKPQQYVVMKSEKDAMPEISMSVFVHEIAGEWEIVSEQEVVAERYNVKRAA